MKKKIFLLLTIVAMVANICYTNIPVEAKITKPSIKKIVNLPNNSVYVIFKCAYAEKYQVMYSTDKKFKKNKINEAQCGYSYDSIVAKVKGLKVNKTYYFKVRTYQEGKYSDWSKAKNIKVKTIKAKSEASKIISLDKSHSNRTLTIDMKYSGNYKNLNNYIDLKIEVLDAKGKFKKTGYAYTGYNSNDSKGSLLYQPKASHFKKGAVWYPEYQKLKKFDCMFSGKVVIDFELPKGLSKLKLKVTATTKTGNKIIRAIY